MDSSLIEQPAPNQPLPDLVSDEFAGLYQAHNCLYDLYCKCLISYDTAISRARHPDCIRQNT